MSIPSTEYQILVSQSFRCRGVKGYTCPVGTFDRSGYTIVGNVALCPACYAVHKQAKQTTTIDPRIQASQRIIHFLHTKNWTVGNGEYTLAFKDFWEEFYLWSEKERMYTKKTLVRSVLAELCGTSHDATHIPISPI
jgi:hypothetical protein